MNLKEKKDVQITIGQTVVVRVITRDVVKKKNGR